jgi:hypothetical protein
MPQRLAAAGDASDGLNPDVSCTSAVQSVMNAAVRTFTILTARSQQLVT